MITIEQNYDPKDVAKELQAGANAWFEDLVRDYKKAGRKFVDKVRAKTKIEGSFGNITWNLRSSIGCMVVYNDGETTHIIDKYFPTLQGAKEGSNTGLAFAEEIALLVEEEGVQLVIVAGMEYAIYVEDHDIDVLSHSSKGFPKELLAEINK